MKETIFELYVSEVCSLFGLTKQDLFSKRSGRIVAHARQFLFWICHKRGMMGAEIVKYSKAYIKLHLSTVCYGIRVISKKAEADNDLVKLERRMRESVSI